MRPRSTYTLRSCTLSYLRHADPKTGQTVTPAILPYAWRCVNSLCDPGTTAKRRAPLLYSWERQQAYPLLNGTQRHRRVLACCLPLLHACTPAADGARAAHSSGGLRHPVVSLLHLPEAEGGPRLCVGALAGGGLGLPALPRPGLGPTVAPLAWCSHRRAAACSRCAVSSKALVGPDPGQR